MSSGRRRSRIGTRSSRRAGRRGHDRRQVLTEHPHLAPRPRPSAGVFYLALTNPPLTESKLKMPDAVAWRRVLSLGGASWCMVAIAGAAAGCQHRQYPEDRSRSEEHTSELQSLMRISYAVFCSKKK